MEMISKRVLVIAMAALLFAGGAVLAGDVVATPGPGGPGANGAVRDVDSVEISGSAAIQECFNLFKLNYEGCAGSNCTTYFWFLEFCDTTALKACRLNAQVAYALCLAQIP